MSLNIGGSGVYRDICKFNAKAGRWYLRSGDDESEIETPTLAIDLNNIATGHLLFLEGAPPNRCMDPSLDNPAPKPSDSHKRGFMVLVYSTKYLNGVAELSSCSMHLCNAIAELHQKFEEMRGEHPGKLPVVACTGTMAMKGKFGTNYRPSFEIVDWADRPEDLPDESPVDPTEIWSGNGGAAAAPPPRPTRADNASDVPTKPAAIDEPASKAEALF